MRPTSPAASIRALLAVIVLLPLVAGCGGGPSGTATAGGTVPPGAGNLPTGVPVTDETRLCDLLGPGDFAAAGIAGATGPTDNADEPGSAYCVYAGTSSGTGGIEFDAFVDEDAAGTFETIVTEAGVDLQDIAVPGADEALGYDGVAGEAGDFAAVVVRKGDLVFTIGAPGGEGTATKLAALAALVLLRAAALAG